jgi:hypothetical protein
VPVQAPPVGLGELQPDAAAADRHGAARRLSGRAARCCWPAGRRSGHPAAARNRPFGWPGPAARLIHPASAWREACRNCTGAGSAGEVLFEGGRQLVGAPALSPCGRACAFL